MTAAFERLRATVLRHAAGLRTPTPIPRLILNLGCEPTGLSSGVVEPMLCLVLQGAKEAFIGERGLVYGEGTYLIAAVELAASGRISQASRDKPYVSLALQLDPQALAGLLPEADRTGGREAEVVGYAVNPATPELVDAFGRLAALLDAPGEIPVLAPMIEREILYRLLQGPQAGVLRQIAMADSRVSQVRRAIAAIREGFDRPLRIGDLADLAGMSAASFHRHFRTTTGMSPLQFQKSLRLHEARRLLVARYDAARAAFAVGYESASQFSREYARAFGAPPARDAQRLRGAPAPVEAYV